MKIDWGSEIKTILGLGSESLERKATRIIIKAALVVLFLIVVWRLIK